MDCVWSEWTLGPCSTTCGAGTQLKIRSKDVVEAHGGSCANDGDAASEIESCNTGTTCPGSAIKILYKYVCMYYIYIYIYIYK